MPVCLRQPQYPAHQQIDRIVYELYGLTKEEIAIVEGESEGANY